MFRKVTAFIFIPIITLFLIVLNTSAQGAQIIVTGYNPQCDNYQISYTVTGGGYYEAHLTVFSPNGALGNALGPGQGGYSYTVNVPVSPPQPEQTYLHVVIELYNGGTLVTSTQTIPDPCYGGGSGGAPPQPPPTNPPSNAGIGGWNGWSDGRLNPDPAEYYSIYCEHSSIKVYGKSNDPNDPEALVERIPLEMVESLSPNGGQMLWNTGFLLPFRVTRNGDTITLEGNFGYLAPQPGSKTFSLSQCQERAAATEPDPGFSQSPYPPPVVVCVDYEGDGFSDPECARLAAQPPAAVRPRP